LASLTLRRYSRGDAQGRRHSGGIGESVHGGKLRRSPKPWRSEIAVSIGMGVARRG
jgi:hypothetical protein